MLALLIYLVNKITSVPIVASSLDQHNTADIEAAHVMANLRISQPNNGVFIDEQETFNPGGNSQFQDMGMAMAIGMDLDLDPENFTSNSSKFVAAYCRFFVNMYTHIQCSNNPGKEPSIQDS